MKFSCLTVCACSCSIKLLLKKSLALYFIKHISCGHGISVSGSSVQSNMNEKKLKIKIIFHWNKVISLFKKKFKCVVNK